MSGPDLLPAMAETRERFLELVAEVRPELHRYCARMTGSIFDGEDVVQDTLAKAYFALSQMEEPPPLRPWLFRIAHNTAMDFLRRYEQRNVELMADVPEAAETEERAVDPQLVETALSVFAALPPVQRSALALKDVLGHSLQEAAATMGVTVAVVKSALVRARANVAGATAAQPSGAGTPSTEERQRLQRYADLFNARNWNGLRALFSEESQLDLVSRWQRRGPATARYFTRYQETADPEDMRAQAGVVEGVPVIAIFRPAASTRPAYFLQLWWRGERIALVRDFRYVPYIAEGVRFA